MTALVAIPADGQHLKQCCLTRCCRFFCDRLTRYCRSSGDLRGVVVKVGRCLTRWSWSFYAHGGSVGSLVNKWRRGRRFLPDEVAHPLPLCCCRRS